MTCESQTLSKKEILISLGGFISLCGSIALACHFLHVNFLELFLFAFWAGFHLFYGIV